MHEINTIFERPPAGLIEQVAQQHVGVAGFEAGPRHVVDPNIKPLDPKWRICGPAFTVCPMYWDDRLMGELAPKYVQPGDVIVVDAGGHTEIAVWGMSMAISAKLAGANGIVIDGSVMNKVLLADERPQVPIFSRGVAPVAKGSEHPGSLNVPVICGGVIVYPGDIILGDADGVVVLRPEMAERIVANSKAHDVRSRAANAKQVPYYEQRDSEAKVRAFDDVIWRD
jgi:4-hydroxy-4-methyl-2-oxoglutarate aldolase